ncbi:MAG: hypothetical protein DRN68_02785 [Thaumarchaeota archaeon]|nr:MAG: hypothetical protein DRN68_02785 [Nitrososphaerota archaeon]
MRLTDAPENFIYAGTLFIMSAVYGPFVKPVLKYYTTARPKIWLWLIGHSGISRKTTVLRLIGQILRGVLPPECFLSPDFTKEGFIEDLRPQGDEPVFRDKPGIVIKDEFGGQMLEIRNKQYLMGLTSFINSLYDETPVSRRLRSERITVPGRNYILFAGGLTTPISEYVSIHDFKSGFANRFMLVYGKSERFIPTFPTEEEEIQIERGETPAERIFNECVEVVKKRYEWIKNLYEANGRQPLRVYVLDEDIRRYLIYFEERIKEFVKGRLDQNPDDVEALYVTRLFKHLVAILTFIAVDKPKVLPDPSNLYFIIDSEHVQQTLIEISGNKILFRGLFRELMEPTLKYLVKDYMTPKRRQLEEKLEAFIKRYNEREGLVSRNIIYQKFTPRLSGKELNELLEALADAGRVRVFKKRGSRGTYLWHIDAGEPPTGSEFMEVRF